MPPYLVKMQFAVDLVVLTSIVSGLASSPTPWSASAVPMAVIHSPARSPTSLLICWARQQMAGRMKTARYLTLWTAALFRRRSSSERQEQQIAGGKSVSALAQRCGGIAVAAVCSVNPRARFAELNCCLLRRIRESMRSSGFTPPRARVQGWCDLPPHNSLCFPLTPSSCKDCAPP
jgi:hypothetical protein